MVRFLTLLFLLGSVQAQTIYCGQDTNLSAKQTLSNMALYSEQFDNAAWANSTSTDVANSIIAPDGTLTADTIVALAQTSPNSRGIYNNAAITVVAGTQYRWSVYLKKGTMRYGSFGPEESPSTANKYTVIDLDTCQPTFYKNTGYTTTGRSIGNGWCYVSVTTSVSITTGYFDIIMAPTATWNSTSYTSTTADTIYVWGASVQLASSPSDYIATAGSAVTLAGVCASGTTQSPLDPTKCIAMTDRGREIRTEAQIAIGSQ